MLRPVRVQSAIKLHPGWMGPIWFGIPQKPAWRRGLALAKADLPVFLPHDNCINFHDNFINFRVDHRVHPSVALDSSDVAGDVCKPSLSSRYRCVWGLSRVLVKCGCSVID
jgi:hypothetical protein